MNESWVKEKQKQFVAAARRDPTKFGVLVGLGLTLGLVAKFQFGGGPASAKAASTATGSANAAKASPTLSAASKIERGGVSDGAVVAWLAQPIKTLDRNLFEFKPEYFPRVAGASAQVAQVVEEELFWDQLAKSMSAQADSKKQRQIRVDNLQAAASKLRVQSTIMGNAPRAMVDGRMIRLGGTVDADTGGSSVAFKVQRIEARRIVIERDGIRIEVPMGSGRVRVLNQDE